VVGGAGVGEFGVGAVRRDDAGVQHRPGRGLLPERAVGVPELIAVAVGAALVVEVENLAALVEVGDIEDVAVLDSRRSGRTAVLAVGLRRQFERAIETGEGRLLFVVEMLIGQHRDRVLVHGACDRVLRPGVDAGGEVDAGQFGSEQRMQWSCRHWRPPGGQAAERRPHSSALAILAPSDSERSFAHMIEGCTRWANGLWAKPQSVPPSTLSRPTILAS